MNVTRVLVVGHLVLLYNERSAQAQLAPERSALHRTKLVTDDIPYWMTAKTEQIQWMRRLAPKP